MFSQTEKDEIFSKYNQDTNMSYSELVEWANNPCSRKASIGRKAINRNLNLKSKNKEQWANHEYHEAKKAISFLARHKGQPSGKFASKSCNLSKRSIALMNWAYNPNK